MVIYAEYRRPFCHMAGLILPTQCCGWHLGIDVYSEWTEERRKFISSRQSTHTVMINTHLSGELLFLPLKLVLLKSHPSSKSSNCTTVCDHLIICAFFSRWYLEKTPYVLEYIFALKSNVPNGFLLEKTVFSLSTSAKRKLIKRRTFSVLHLRSYPGRHRNYKFLLQLKVHRTNLQ